MNRIFMTAAFLAMVAVEAQAQEAGKFASVPWVDQPVGTEPVIVRHGWTSPDTIYLRRNIAELEKRPFTGTVTWISWPRQENGRLMIKGDTGNPPKQIVYDLTRRIITKQRLPAEAIEGALADLKATSFSRFKHNFLQTYFIVAPGLKPNFWYDDELWTVACQNFADVARVAKQGGCKGFFINAESREALWSYVAMKEADPSFYADKTWEQTQSKARQRGREVAIALNSEFPDIVLLFMRGYSSLNDLGLHPASDLRYNRSAGLYEAFLDGLLEGSTDQTIIVDGCDNGSSRTDVDRFAGYRYRALEAPLRTGVTQVPEQFKKKMRVGFGFYLASTDKPWNPRNPNENQFNPQDVQDFVRLGLQFGDGYLWFWDEWICWWLDNPDARPADGVKILDGIQWVPQEYWRAIEDGVRDARHWKSHPNLKYYQ